VARNEVRGVRETSAALRALASGFTPRMLDEVREEALQPMQRSVREFFVLNGSYKTGAIPDEFVIVKSGQNEHTLGCTGIAAKLMHIIEFGAAPHEQPRRGTWHPGSEPKPAFRPAYEETAQLTMETAARALSIHLERIAVALRR
jgi:hypothetical protein